MRNADSLKRALDFIKVASGDKNIRAAGIGLAIAGAGLVSFVSKEEGTEYKPYEDIVGVLTVCQGHTGPDIIRGKTYTKEECDGLLRKDLTVHGEAVLRCTKVPLNQNQYDAFTSFTYNVGTGAYCSSTLVKLLNQGKYQEACDQLLRWNRAGGKEVRGLTNRRIRERELCLKPVSPAPTQEIKIA